jgi:hypothetical protein
MDDQLVIQFSTAAPPIGAWWQHLIRHEDIIDWSKLIRRGCHSPFSHVDMHDGDGLIGASNNPTAPILKTDPPGAANGVAKRPFDYQEFLYRRNMILVTPRANDIRRIWRTQLGKAFDMSYIRGMISEQFPGARDWRLDEHWACAEGIVWSMEVGEFWNGEKLAWPKNRVSPTDVLMLLLMDKRWTNREQFWLPIPGLKLGPRET